jgi:Cu-Zn family superoxide dismutase
MTKYLLLLCTLLLSYPLMAAKELKDTAPVPTTAKAELKSKSGSEAKGIAQFTESKEGLQVRYKFSGLAKNQEHGFHIHERGDCSSKDAKSAGPHFKKIVEGEGTSKDNPDRYAGDMPQVESDENGNAEGIFLLSQGGINRVKHVKNRAVILHGGPDDITKVSAPRIACGVIRQVKAN